MESKVEWYSKYGKDDEITVNIDDFAIALIESIRKRPHVKIPKLRKLYSELHKVYSESPASDLDEELLLKSDDDNDDEQEESKSSTDAPNNKKEIKSDLDDSNSVEKNFPQTEQTRDSLDSENFRSLVHAVSKQIKSSSAAEAGISREVSKITPDFDNITKENLRRLYCLTVTMRWDL